ncbi:MAG: hypothetical protein WBL50_14115, partial [Candidatus Acidiferrum sp.]
MIARHQNRREWLFGIALLYFLGFSIAAASQDVPKTTSTAASGANADGYVGNQACAKCHATIYESYM